MKYIFIMLFLSLLMGCQRKFISDETAAVHLTKKEGEYKIIRNGKPFLIKGASGPGSIRKLKAIGGNTIRLYDTLDLQNKLDTAQKYGVAVIVDIPLPESEEDSFYEDDQKVQRAVDRISATAKHYRSHPALLMWCLGNEPLYYDLTDFSFSTAFNRMLKALKKSDPDHLVGTATAFIGNRQSINYRLKFPDIDVLMINTFGSLYNVATRLNRYKYFWDIPFIISEYGEQGPWEVEATIWGAPVELNTTDKASRLELTYRNQMPLEHPRFLGSLAFYWGHQQEVTHSWFNFFSESGETNALYYSLAKNFGSQPEGNQPPVVQDLRVNGSNRINDFLFKSQQSISASLDVTDPDRDSLKIEWTVYPEDWFFKIGDRPPLVPTRFSTVRNEQRVRFRTPEKPGPYRLFAKITDGKDHFATANLPFYVVP